MEEALLEYRNGEIGFNEECRKYGIPKPTLRRRVKGLNKTLKYGRPKDLTTEMEDESEPAEKYQLPHRFNNEKKIGDTK